MEQYLSIIMTIQLSIMQPSVTSSDRPRSKTNRKCSRNSAMVLTLRKRGCAPSRGLPSDTKSETKFTKSCGYSSRSNGCGRGYHGSKVC